MFFVCLISCVKQLSNCLTSFNLYGKASLFYHAYWIINNVHLNYKNSPPKQNPRNPIAMCFVVLSKVPYPLHAEMVQNSCCMFKLFYSWYILPTIPLLSLSYLATVSTWLIQSHYSAITHLYWADKIFFYLSHPSPFHAIYRTREFILFLLAVSVFNISRRCFNWGVLELSQVVRHKT